MRTGDFMFNLTRNVVAIARSSINLLLLTLLS